MLINATFLRRLTMAGFFKNNSPNDVFLRGYETADHIEHVSNCILIYAYVIIVIVITTAVLSCSSSVNATCIGKSR